MVEITNLSGRDHYETSNKLAEYEETIIKTALLLYTYYTSFKNLTTEKQADQNTKLWTCHTIKFIKQ